ncbi:NADH pyrophosphatase zinc ribbon domain/NUDIX domain containing protein [Novymonas esmeraldas]|uniref:NAD(+) diphosphatase n=1 Tax=Novymonas esmeraldas TaxID=1808958 RepID=A0AAW0ET15_9TRYP
MLERTLAKSSLLSFPLGQTVVVRHEKERRAPGFIADRVVPAAGPCAVVCKEDGSRVLLGGGGAAAGWLHRVPAHAAEEFMTVPLAEAVYVGEDVVHSRNVFVVGEKEVQDEYVRRCEWVPPMSVFPSLCATDQSLLSLALSMKLWAVTTAFCARCGGAMKSLDHGMTRDCTTCKHRIYPTVMPAMIVAVLDGKGNVILSLRHRHRTCPKGRPMRTVLSGFVAQGESMEETVVREVMEETGATVTSLRYVGSQPWPAPFELMTCYYAVADNSPVITAQEDELISVHWVSKEDVRLALAGENPEFSVVHGFSAANVLLSKWANGEVDDWGRPATPS